MQPGFNRRRIIYAVAATLLILSGAAWWFFGRETESDAVKRQLEALCSEGSKNGRLGELAMAAKARAIQKLFAPECRFDVDERDFSGTMSNGAIAANALNALKALDRVEASVSDISEVEFPEPGYAVVEFTLRLKGEAGGNERFDDVRELTGTLRKYDGEWLFAAFKVRRIMRK